MFMKSSRYVREGITMSWQDKLRQVEPYVAGEQPKINNMIKLNTE